MPGERFSSLLAAAGEGDEAAWSEIYRGLAPAVLGYLRANGAPEPEDVLAEVFLQVARDLDSFEGDETGFRSWVFTIAHHRLIDARRHSARRPLEPMDELPEPDPAFAPDAESEALARIRARELGTILSGLTADQRTVLLLRVVADLGVAEVARVVGKRPGAVKQLQRRALAAVQRELERRGVTT
jgi:RNA polymerase sigma-70 factor (ECF subfamily)